MSVEALTAVGAQLAATVPAAPAASAIAPAADINALAGVNPADGVFHQLLDSLGDINTRMQANSQATTELALGQTDNLHEVMISAERTRLQFDLMMSMRNRVLEAYQEIMRMQV